MLTHHITLVHSISLLYLTHRTPLHQSNKILAIRIYLPQILTHYFLFIRHRFPGYFRYRIRHYVTL